jgi:hypothetical protein
MSLKKHHSKPPEGLAPESAVETTASAPNQTKKARLLKLLGQKEGATLVELTFATGWLPHTTRAAITALRKGGRDVWRERVAGVSRYKLGVSEQ